MNSYEICLSTPTHGKIGNHRNMCYESERDRERVERERERECVSVCERERIFFVRWENWVETRKIIISSKKQMH